MAISPADGPAADKPPRLLASLRQLALSGLAMAHTRLALAGIEIEEELQRLVSLLLGLLGLLVFGLVGLLVLTFTVVLAVDAGQRVAVLAGFSVLYLGLAMGFGWRVWRMVSSRPPFMQATLAEMARDGEALGARQDTHG
jgi:uncharacterized membrane protein YqjE